MEINILKEANMLHDEIKMVERLINSCKNQKCEFIFFSHGNGMSKEVVCNHIDIIEKVRSLILIENEAKLKELTDKLKEL